MKLISIPPLGTMMTTRYDGAPREHVLMAAKLTPHTQSGVSYQVKPPPRNHDHYHWLDSAWFKEVPFDVAQGKKT